MNFDRGIGVFVWQLSVALYLVINGILGLQQYAGGDFLIMFKRMGLSGNPLNILVICASVIALVAGIALLLELFSIEIPFLDTLVFIVAIIWAVYIVINIVSWMMGGFQDVLHELQRLAVHLMVFASLLVASKKFD